MAIWENSLGQHSCVELFRRRDAGDLGIESDRPLRNLIKAPTETAVPSARLRSILQLSNLSHMTSHSVSSNRVRNAGYNDLLERLSLSRDGLFGSYVHQHSCHQAHQPHVSPSYGHYAVDSDLPLFSHTSSYRSTLYGPGGSSLESLEQCGYANEMHGSHRHVHSMQLPPRSTSHESHKDQESQYKEWMDRRRAMCPCSSALLAANPRAAGIFLCRRRSCVHQLLSLETGNATLPIALSCDVQFPADGMKDNDINMNPVNARSPPKLALNPDAPKLALNPDAPVFVPRSNTIAASVSPTSADAEVTADDTAVVAVTEQ